MVLKLAMDTKQIKVSKACDGTLLVVYNVYYFLYRVYCIIFVSYSVDNFWRSFLSFLLESFFYGVGRG